MGKEMEQTFGQRLRELRRAAGIRQRDLADRIGVDFSYISKLENDRLPPPAGDTTEKICRELGVSSDELLASTGKVPTQIKEVFTDPAALGFIRKAHELGLTSDEWKRLTSRLNDLRDEDDDG